MLLGPSRAGRLRFFALGLSLFLSAGSGLFSAPLPGDPDAPSPAGAVEIVIHDGYPELRVDGAPFFVHGATFDYFRVPRDLWESSLERYRALGINTIDLAIPWNWHQQTENEFDFDGHTNPRRDLRSLLRIIAEKRFHLIVRPAPVIRSHWRHGGYPDWMLARAGFEMDPAERAAGRMPPLAEEEAHDADAAARAWMENAAHMAAIRAWLSAVARELAPYSPTRKVKVSDLGEEPNGKREIEINGPLLFVQLDESPGLDSPPDCSHFWLYMDSLRQTLQAGGVNALYRINAVASDRATTVCTPPNGSPFALTGRWSPPEQPQMEAAEEHSTTPPAPRHIAAPEALAAERLAQALSLQPGVPSLVSDFQAGSFTPADDVRPPAIAPSNALLATRLLLAQGIQGLEYAPLQDTLTPAGYATRETNRYYRWDAPLNLSGRHQPQATGVARNAQLIQTWGQFLAASHKRADFAVVDPRAGHRDAADASRTSQLLAKIERIGLLAGSSGDLVNPDSQPTEVFLRYPVVLLPVLDPSGQRIDFSANAQARLADYVREGGTLICFPGRPAGRTLEQLWQAAPPGTAQEPGSLLPSWRFGEGRVIEWDEDFYSWVDLDRSLPDIGAQPGAIAGVQSFRAALAQAGVRPSLKRGGFALLASERISDAGTGKLGARPRRCALEDSEHDAFGPLCNRGLLSVTNLNYDEPVQEQLQVLSPRAGVHGADDDYLPLDVQVPAHESLLLPLHAPLCSENPKQKCEDEVVIAGAELFHAEREGKSLLLTFYTPARATIVLHLESQPTKLSIGDINLEGTWIPETHLLELALPRGASPNFLRVLAVRLKYTPHVPVKPDPHKRPRQNFEAAVADAITLPLGEDASLPSYPPLVLLGLDRKGSLIYQAENHDEMGREVSVKIEGEIRGSSRLGLDPHEMLQEKINLSPAVSPSGFPDTDSTSPVPTSGFYSSELRAHSGRFERNTPLSFVAVGPELPVAYAFDFDRDGAREWVLENVRLRLIIAPEDGGRALALVDKTSGTNLTTPVGALRDLFALGGAGGESPVLRDVTFNRSYSAEQLAVDKRPALRLRYRAPEIGAGGAEIEKTLQISGLDTVEAEYHVKLLEPSGPAASLVVLHSMPAQGGGDRSTRFCWQPPNAHGTGPATTAGAPAPTCELFIPGGDAIEPPAGIQQLEVRTPGQPTLVLAWEEGRLRIEPKTFSALLKLEFPSLAPGGAAGKYTLRYTVIPVESLQ